MLQRIGVFQGAKCAGKKELVHKVPWGAMKAPRVKG